MWSNEAAKVLACLAAAGMATACAGADVTPHAQGVCPVRPQAVVTQIDLFDGDPADQALLAPDDDRRGSNTYSVKSVYDAGRSLTIRCHYGDASTDVKLVKPVTTCTYSGGDAHPALTCR